MKISEIKEGRFDTKSTYIEFEKPVAVKAVNMINDIFTKKGYNERAIYHDKVTISIEGQMFDTDVVDFVMDELGGGEYFDYY